MINHIRDPDAVGAAVLHDARKSEDAGDVVLGLAGQVQVPEVGREPGSLVALHCVRYPGDAAVVGGKGQEPVPVKLLVEVGEEIERRVSRAPYVPSLVVVLGNPEPEVPCGYRGHLPEADGAHVGLALDLEAALEERNQDELSREPALPDLAVNGLYVGR